MNANQALEMGFSCQQLEMGTGVDTQVSFCVGLCSSSRQSKMQIDMHRAFLSSWEPYTAQPSPRQPPAGGRFPERACLHSSWTGGAGKRRSRTLGDSKPLLRPPGWDSPTAEPAQLGQVGTRVPAHYKSQKAKLRAGSGGAGGRGPAAALPAASLVLRLLPALPSPVPVSLRSTLKGYFLWKHMRGTLSSLYTDAPRVLAFSLSARTEPNSLTGVGQRTQEKANFGGNQPGST